MPTAPNSAAPTAPSSAAPDSFGRRGAASLLRRLGVLAATFALAATGVAMSAVQPAHAASIIHVSPSGSNSANGTASSPVRTVGRAVQMARSGDTVQIATGTYHEQVQVYSKEVHLTAGPGATVVFDGTVPTNGWSQSGGDWYTSWSTDFSRASQPHVLAERPEAGWPEQFFFDDSPLAEVTSRAAVIPGTFFNDRAADRVWIGDNPTGHRVDGSDLAWGIYLNHANGSTVTNITVRRYATPTSNMAAVRAYANNLTLSGLVAENNAYMGVSAIGSNISIDRLVSRSNGHLGAHGHQSAGLSVTNSLVTDNNAEGFDAHHAAGGIKVTETTGLTVSDSTVTNNAGPGIWTDLDTNDVVVANNLVTGNSRSGIEIELSFDVTVINNSVAENGEAGIWILESQNARVWHNAAFKNVRDLWIEEGPRADVNVVEVVNNTLGGGAPGAPAILNVDDWTGQRSAEAMRIELSANRYWLPNGSATANLSRWANWPYPLALSPTIEQHRSATGQDGSAALSTATSNPYVRNEAASDYRQPVGASTGAAMPASIASVAGVAAGSAYPAGPLAAAGGGVAPPPPTTPTTTPSTTTPSTTTPSTAPTTTAPSTTVTTTPSVVLPSTIAPNSTPHSVPDGTLGGVTSAANRAEPGKRSNSSTSQAVRVAAQAAIDDVAALGSAGFAGAVAVPPAPQTAPASAATDISLTIRGWHALAAVVGVAN